MKIFYACLLLVFSGTTSLYAQEIDTIPINTKGLNIKLKRSPLPSRTGTIPFKPVGLDPVVVDARVNYWKTRTSVGINVNQATFSNNWKGGGVNSLAVGGIVNYKAEYSKEGYSYVSEVILEYGKVKNKDQLQKKTRDRIFWDNKAALQLSKNWYFFGSVNFESQFDSGFSYTKKDGNEVATLISKFMAPGYLTESMGFEYKPSKYFSTRIGTGTARQTFVLDSAVYFNSDGNKVSPKYGVEFGKKFKNELAFQIVSNFEKEIFTNTMLKARYQMFIPYDRALIEIDHRLDVSITSKLNRLMNVSLTCVGLFDKDNDPKIQGSQALALGVSFYFPR
ncbi:MAG: DUF3078 domain-containing protein [Candidatus Pedobacter colombiensis]|uniref:DUF3078 domain-containing protein n=1 Tax=Candidatus Pedobacter colombiensis TaxID=3121371 RepID=A0AAJ6B8Q3_9SPHI|nr:DUF3078 domain-containing protein [Pedobacter sp.]WEK19383.1 MAG: DUF3078 domain-containing protein [Pedobacter sp.]